MSLHNTLLQFYPLFTYGPLTLTSNFTLFIVTCLCVSPFYHVVKYNVKHVDYSLMVQYILYYAKIKEKSRLFGLY